ncbi:hypothetical protein KZ779_03275 [Escherichia coli]|nr:hypothetical protein [Escherichia coli]
MVIPRVSLPLQNQEKAPENRIVGTAQSLPGRAAIAWFVTSGRPDEASLHPYALSDE